MPQFVLFLLGNATSVLPFMMRWLGLKLRLRLVRTYIGKYAIEQHKRNLQQKHDGDWGEIDECKNGLGELYWYFKSLQFLF